MSNQTINDLTAKSGLCAASDLVEIDDGASKKASFSQIPASVLDYTTRLTYAKLQQVAATARLLGRKTAGAGTIEELAQADVATLMGMSANGLSLVQAANYAAMLTALGLSANGASLVTAADYAAMKVLLALTIGTNVQAWSAKLDAAAALSGAVLATTDTQTLTNKRKTARVTTAAISSNAITPAGDSSDIVKTAAVAAALTINAPTGTPADGDILQIWLLNDATGGYALTWNSVFAASVTQALPTTSGTASKFQRILFQWSATGSKWVCISVVDGGV